jgi:proteic killer suppression protein
LSIDKRQATPDSNEDVIRSVKHRGLKALYDGGTSKKVALEHVEKLRDILALLDHCRGPRDVDLPGLRVHPLKGALAGHYEVSVSGNWRVIFRFEGGDVFDVDYADCH